MYSILLLIIIGVFYFHNVVYANQYFNDKIVLRFYLTTRYIVIGSPPKIVYSSYPLRWVNITIQYLDGTKDIFYIENPEPSSWADKGYEYLFNINIYPNKVFNMKIFYKCYNRTFSIELRNIYVSWKEAIKPIEKMWLDNALSIYTLDGHPYSYKHYEQIIHRIDFVKSFEVHGIILETFLFIKKESTYIPVNIPKAFRLILMSTNDTYQMLVYHNISYTPYGVRGNSSNLISTYIGKPVIPRVYELNGSIDNKHHFYNELPVIDIISAPSNLAYMIVLAIAPIIAIIKLSLIHI